MDFSDPGNLHRRRGGQAATETATGWQTVPYEECACGNLKMVSEYVCAACFRLGSSPPPMVLAVDHPQVITDKDSRGGCEKCAYTERCRARVPQNLPVLCEIADENDLCHVLLG